MPPGSAAPSLAVLFGFLVLSLFASPLSAQTPQLLGEADRIMETLSDNGVSDRSTFFSALESARAAERLDEYASLRSLGIDMPDEAFDAAWQNEPGRSSFHDPYDIEMWTYDVLRSWGKVAPRPAFVWTYATQDSFGYHFGEWQGLSRIAVDWARSSTEAAREAEIEALALPEGRLRQLAIHGVIRGNILRGDGERAEALFAHLTVDELRRDADALYRRYIGGE